VFLPADDISRLVSVKIFKKLGIDNGYLATTSQNAKKIEKICKNVYVTLF